ncbi:MAG: hypothetical protein FWC76_08125, partial [Defluviitaleaceae bacterium]|nr:hypothetical protein [Defluviitaleaceae bacterium]
MRFRRKIAAALALVMAFGSIAALNVEARDFGPNPRQGFHGTFSGHANGHRLVEAEITGTGLHRAVDLVLAGNALLNHTDGNIGTMTLRIDGPAVWNYGAPFFGWNHTGGDIRVGGNVPAPLPAPAVNVRTD